MRFSNSNLYAPKAAALIKLHSVRYSLLVALKCLEKEMKVKVCSKQLSIVYTVIRQVSKTKTKLGDVA